MREVTRVLVDDAPAAGHRLVRLAAVRDRDHPVVLAPDEQRRHLRGQVEAVARRDALAADVHDARGRCARRPAAPPCRPSDANPRAISSRSRPGRRPARPSSRAIEAPAFRSGSAHSSGSTYSARREGRGAQQQAAPPRRGRRSRRAPAARPAPGTGRRTASPPLRRASGRRSSPCRRRGRSAGRARRSRRRRASSRRAASRTRRGRAGRVRSPCGARASGGITSSHVRELPVMPWIRTIADPVPDRRKLTRWPCSCDFFDHRICTPEIARAITSRWISDVPSKIV